MVLKHQPTRSSNYNQVTAESPQPIHTVSYTSIERQQQQQQAAAGSKCL
jgi:hypothetical protein